MTPNDPFELEVKDAFRRHIAALDPSVPMPVVRSRRAGSLGPIRVTRTSRALPGLAFGLVVVLAVAALVLGPAAFRGSVSATPSASQPPAQPRAQWTRLDWSRARTDASTIEGDAPNAAWHDGWALANGGSVFYSTDGAWWSETLQFPSTSVLGIVAPAPRGFVALDTIQEPADDKLVQAAVWQSDDGRSWREASTSAAFNGQNQIWDAAGGPRGIVAIGLSAPVGARMDATARFGFGAWYSPDGAVWQRISDAATFGSDPAFAIAATRDGFLMGGTFGGAPVIWKSSDGVHWERIVLTSETGRRVRMIAAGAAGIIAIDGLIDARDGYAGRAWTSRDGSHWTPLDSPDVPAWVTGDGVRISGWWDDSPTPAPVPTSDSPTSTMYRHVTSLDGISWSAVADARRSWWLAYSDHEVLALDGGKFHVVPVVAATGPSPRPSASMGPASPSPTEASPSSASPSPSSLPSSSVSTPSMPVSPPTAAWGSLRFTSEAAGGELPWAYAWPDGMIAGDANNEGASLSSYGQDWERITLPARTPALVWTGSRLIAVADEGDGKPRPVWGSGEGRTWTRIDDGSYAPSAPPLGIASGPAGIIVVTASGEVWRSADGARWTHAALGGMSQREVTGITATERGYVIVVRNGIRDGSGPNDGVTLLASADGLTWSSSAVTADPWAWVHVYVLGDGFVAYGGVFESRDGPPSNALVDRGWRWVGGSTWQPIEVPSNFEVDGSAGDLIIGHEHQVFGPNGSGNPLVLYQSENGETWQSLPVAAASGTIHAPLIVATHGVFIHSGFSLAPLLYYEGVGQ